jgi:trypsin-like peptidase
MTRRFSTALLLGLAVAPASSAQTVNRAPDNATSLVVKVSYFDASGRFDFGAGIIVGVDSKQLYIATAGHVVQKGAPAARVYVTMPTDTTDSAVATVSDSVRENMDIAVLTIPRSDLSRGVRLPALDRLGRADDLQYGDPVSPMGCPQSFCWGVPAPADRVVGIDAGGIIFQSAFVKIGSSGGALFNQWWEVVGLVTEDAPPRANAVPIDGVLALVRAWGYPVSLHRAKVPRAGYRLHVGALVLTRVGGSENALGAQGRFPSGRLVAARRGDLYGVIWHLSGLRLAPRNLAVTAAMGGVGLNFHYGRFTAQPFVEIGVGRVEGRFDAGGYFVSGNDPYVPLWRQQKQDGLGAGGGLSIQALLAPHVTLELLGGHWSFNVPDSVSTQNKLPTFFVGTGLRWGL